MVIQAIVTCKIVVIQAIVTCRIVVIQAIVTCRIVVIQAIVTCKIVVIQAIVTCRIVVIQAIVTCNIVVNPAGTDYTLSFSFLSLMCFLIIDPAQQGDAQLRHQLARLVCCNASDGSTQGV